MRVRIIASKPIDKDCSDITQYIGQEFEAYYVTGEMYININDNTDLLVFEGEYEVVAP